MTSPIARGVLVASALVGGLALWDLVVDGGQHGDAET
jgi:hypothetical protein